MFTDTLPNGAVTLRPVRQGATVFLAHTQEELRGRDGWLVPAAGLVLGRELAAGSFALVDPRMSRTHAAIELVDGGLYQVRDLGSRNGTGVNGHRLDGVHRLASGDVLRVGDTLAVFAHPALPPGGAPDAFGLLGQSVAIAGLRQALKQAARTRTHVLVRGEGGSGKEVVARALHLLAGQPGPFVVVACSGAGETHLHAEIFARARAALERGGTLYLDGLGELPLTLQLELERTLAATAALSGGAGVRVIAATSRDLAAEVRAGRFRADLHARLSACTIDVPALRARREDIPLLVADRLARAGHPGRALDADLCQALLLSPWPLNVRGLVNVVETALRVTAAGRPLALADQVAQMFAVGDALTATVAPENADPGELAQVPRGRAPVADELRAALAQSGGNVAEAARQFGCSRQQIYRWMRALGVGAGEFRRS